MPRLMFGIAWGASVPPVVIPPPPPPFWVTLTADTLQWQAVTVGQIPRFEHIYPQDSGIAQQFVKILPPT